MSAEASSGVLRVLFVKGTCSTGERETVRPPLGVQYLSACLRAHHSGPIETALVDLRLPNVSVDDVAAKAAQMEPHVVGISALTVEAASTVAAFAAVKRVLPAVPVVLGGPYATSTGPAVLDEVPADFVVLGEGERTFCALARLLATAGPRPPVRMLREIPSLLVRFDNGATPLHTAPASPVADLDSLPFPDRELVNEDAYRSTSGAQHVREVYAPVQTSRGCPFECTYCHRLEGRGFRSRSAANVVAELTRLAEQGQRRIAIVDDIFNLDIERAAAICRGIIRRDLGLAIKFGNGLRTDMLSPRLVELLVRAGTVRVCVAVETGSPRTMRRIRKRLRYDRVLAAIAELRRHGVLTQGMFMLGFPGERPDEIEETVAYACRTDLDMATFFKVVPQPGTALYKEAVGLDPAWPEKLRTGDYWYHARRSFYEDVTGYDLHDMWRNAMWRFYDPARVRRLVDRGGEDAAKWTDLLEQSLRWHSQRRVGT